MNILLKRREAKKPKAAVAPPNIHETFRFQVCIYLAVQYHRALPAANQHPMFCEHLDPYIAEFEPQFGGGKKPDFSELSASLEAAADVLDAYLEKVVEGDVFRFKLLASVGSIYFDKIRERLIDNLLLAHRNFIASELADLKYRRGFKQARLNQERQRLEKAIARPVNHTGKYLAQMRLDNGLVKSLQNYCESRLFSTL